MRTPHRLAQLLLATLSLATLAWPAGAGIARSAAWNAESVAVGGIPVVLQSEENSCGPAVIATLASLVGGPLSEREVLAMAHLGPSGITLAEFSRLASAFGLAGAWYRVPLSQAGRLTTPFVVQLEDGESGHFVAVLGLRHGYAVVADPAHGAVAGPLRSVLPGYSGRVFRLRVGG